MQNVYVTPAKDAEGNAKRVPDPVTGHPLPAGGASKQRSQFWLRRIAAGDVTEGHPPAELPTAQPAPAVVEEAPATAIVGASVAK